MQTMALAKRLLFILPFMIMVYIWNVTPTACGSGGTQPDMSGASYLSRMNSRLPNQGSGNLRALEIGGDMGSSSVPLIYDLANPGATVPTVWTCIFDFTAMIHEPSRFPTIPDLAEYSCPRRRKTTLSAVTEAMEVAALDDEGRRKEGWKNLTPSGFIFHEGRAGGTVVSNILASIPHARVFAQHPGMERMLNHVASCGPDCKRDNRIKKLRQVANVLSQPFRHGENLVPHTHLFFSFSSELSTSRHIAAMRDAFPDTPWVFVHRDEEEALAANLADVDGKGLPRCAATKTQPPPDVAALLGAGGDAAAAAIAASRLTDEQYCSVVLGAQTHAALQQLNLSGSKGVALSYRDLSQSTSTSSHAPANDPPHPFLDVLLPDHFGLRLNAVQRGPATVAARRLTDSKQQQQQQQGAASSRTVWRSDLNPSLTQQQQQQLKESIAKYQRSSSSALSTLGAAYLKEAKGRVVNSLPPALRPGKAGPVERYCPDTPPTDGSYPRQFLLTDLLDNWPADEVEPPLRHYDTLCRLHYQRDHDKAMRYRNAELPFVIYGVPEHEESVNRWTPDYLSSNIVDPHRMEISTTNHFMYWNNVKGVKRDKDWVKPTQVANWEFDQWFEKAQNDYIDAMDTHYYFRVNGNTGYRPEKYQTEKYKSKKLKPIPPPSPHPGDAFVERDLPFFANQESLFIREPLGQEGIHCRFGMRGVIAECHFDFGRNMVAMMKGSKRYVLQPTRECDNVYLLPKGHPSARHSQVNWSNPDLEKWPLFKQSQAVETVLSAGEILFIPQDYLHFIVSLGLNIQCNTRSGSGPRPDVKGCGF